MPSPINGAAAAGAIASLIRQAIATPGGTQRKARSAGRPGKTAQPDQRPQGQQGLSELITARASELSSDSRDHRRRLLRLVIEATLLHEFGSGLLNAPKFQSMVDQVLHELESVPSLQKDVSSVLDDLTNAR